MGFIDVTIGVTDGRAQRFIRELETFDNREDLRSQIQIDFLDRFSDQFRVSHSGLLREIP